MIDLSSILQAISRLRPDLLQGLMGGGQGGGMQSANGGGFQAAPFPPQPAGPPWMAQPFEPMPIDPMPMPAKGGGFPTQVVPDVPGAGSGGRSAGMGMFGRDRASLPRQPIPDRFRSAQGAPMGGVSGNQATTRPAPLGGRRTGGAIVRPSGNTTRTRPAAGRGENAIDPRKRRRPRRTY